MARAQESGDARMLARLWLNSGAALIELGKLNQAEEALAQALKLAREQGVYEVSAMALTNLGDIAIAHASYERAVARYEESNQIFEKIGNVLGLAINLLYQGYVLYLTKSYVVARAKILEALQVLKKLGDRAYLVECLDGLTLLEIQQSSFERAAILSGAAAALHTALGTAIAPAMRKEYPRALSALKAQMGAADFEEAWEKGSVMNLEEAMGLVVGNEKGVMSYNPSD